MASDSGFEPDLAPELDEFLQARIAEDRQIAVDAAAGQRREQWRPGADTGTCRGRRPRRPAERGGPGGVGLRLSATRIGAVTVGYVRFGRDVRIETAEAENYHLDLPRSGAMVARAGRDEPVLSTPRLAAVFTPGSPVELRWPADCRQYCLMIPRAVVHREFEAMLDRPVPGPVTCAPAMDVGSGAGRTWLDLLRLIEQQAECRHGLLDHPLAMAHQELRSADPHVATVSGIAGRWGFAYLGRFAAAYRERFGESQTLRRPWSPAGAARTAPDSAHIA